MAGAVVDDIRPALDYLRQSGAAAILVGAAGSIGVPRKTDVRLSEGSALFWVQSDQATATCRRARRHAGTNPDARTSTAALRQAAGELRAVLTENKTAIARATLQANRLTEYMQALQANGTMHDFNRTYRERRAAAVAAGKGYSSYGHMLLRLRRALIPILASGDPRARAQFKICEIFERCLSPRRGGADR